MHRLAIGESKEPKDLPRYVIPPLRIFVLTENDSVSTLGIDLYRVPEMNARGEHIISLMQS